MAKFSIRTIVGKRVMSVKTPAGSRYTFFRKGRSGEGEGKWVQLDTKRDSDEAINERVALDVEFFRNAEENRGKFEVVEGFLTNDPQEPEPEAEPVPVAVEPVAVKPITRGKKKRGGK